MAFPAIEWSYPRALLVLFGVAIGVALLVAASTSGTAFGTFNPSWEGTSELRAAADRGGTEGSVIRETAAYANLPAERSVVLILAPREPYSADAVADIRSYVDRGGTLLVAEDFGDGGNELLARLGAGARVDGRLLRDERFNYRSPARPIAADVADHPLVAGVDNLTVNHGTAVDPNGATVLVNTSEFAYLDGNRDGVPNANETLARVPVLTVERVGDGRVIVLGDPSVFINAMLERPGNRQLVSGLVDRYDYVALDVSHAGSLPPLAAGLLIVRATPWLQAVVGLVALGAVAVLARRPDLVERTRGRLLGSDEPVEPRTGLTRAELRSIIQERYPGWDDRRVERIITSMRPTDEPGDE